MGLIAATYPTNEAATIKRTCPELGLYFILPEGFTPIDSVRMAELSNRGKNAVKETFDKEILQGWQSSVCLNLQDSLKRMIQMQAITVKEAIAADGSVDKFIDKTFSDGNQFIIQRFKKRIDIEIDEKETVKQSQITIAGLKVRKNEFTLNSGLLRLFYARYYFFQKDGKLFLLSFLGSPKAGDNEEIVRAIENAKPI